ncbi:undecaprenyldiphospho-muramoylpentapeptide beta-N-acetylglucosaminyltransferase [Pontibacterium granulatum]|uniref:undecaprenyldiphospho-muramoylpentapeptide beta-N-acetylglucosaminyltransferase n=1 Tax=Pontibacterium granulatum TaxID=2036029 RepID=UPI00249B59B9|nr:undecaprenyldiphospho-muramoylpentapeptide beta-N-acetylglucosaminyltransferase [Pontibacterium granulatum]MDI3323635.1 undecaprenyldiphospho-muramoylpentapeptide beta-N-acetylglucosaminyltransferase [Pontibacterium granulatum]
MAKQPVALIMAGGTGGHVFPALATAHELQRQGVHVEWLGTQNGIEARVIPEADIKLHCIDVAGLRGKGRLSLLLAPFKVLLAIWQALVVLRQVKPDVVLGMGGFASGPGGVAAKLLGKPLVIHEQNAIAGMTNKILSKMAWRVLEAFEDAFPAETNTETVGNPVRGPILQMNDPRERYGNRSGKIRLLVVGGSLGAKAINETLPEVLAQMPEAQRPEVWHQTGKRTYEETLERYQRLGLDARVVPFIEQMDEAYGWADLVLCRAGALTVSELAIAGVAAILVPFPFAVDDHQTANAKYLAQLDAAQLVPQPELTVDRLKELLTEKFSQREKLGEMAANARALGRPEAGARVAEVCLEAMKR